MGRLDQKMLVRLRVGAPSLTPIGAVHVRPAPWRAAANAADSVRRVCHGATGVCAHAPSGSRPHSLAPAHATRRQGPTRGHGTGSPHAPAARALQPPGDDLLPAWPAPPRLRERAPARPKPADPRKTPRVSPRGKYGLGQKPARPAREPAPPVVRPPQPTLQQVRVACSRGGGLVAREMAWNLDLMRKQPSPDKPAAAGHADCR